MSGLSEMFEGAVPVTVPCKDCGDSVPLATLGDPAFLFKYIEEGLVIPLCGPCGIASQAKRFLENPNA